MTRNMDLIREILIRMRDHEHGYAPKMSIEGYSDEEISFHCYLLHDAGLIDAFVGTTMSSTSPDAVPRSLTWAGYEFIENAYDQKIWNESKEVMQKVGAASFSVWTSVLTQTVMKNLGI